MRKYYINSYLSTNLLIYGRPLSFISYLLHKKGESMRLPFLYFLPYAHGFTACGKHSPSRSKAELATYRIPAGTARPPRLARMAGVETNPIFRKSSEKWPFAIKNSGRHTHCMPWPPFDTPNEPASRTADRQLKQIPVSDEHSMSQKKLPPIPPSASTGHPYR